MSDITFSASHHRAKNGDLAMHVDIGDITENLTAHFAGLDVPIETAIKRALTKLGRWLRTHSVKEISKTLRIKQSAIKNRYRFHRSGQGSDEVLNIWVGLLAISAHNTGTALQNKQGTKVSGRQFDSAFKARIFDNEERVFIRSAANRRQGHLTLGDPTQKMRRQQRANRQKREGSYRGIPQALQGRFPVEVVGVEIEEVSRDVLERYEKRLNKRYGELLTQELNYVLNVE